MTAGAKGGQGEPDPGHFERFCNVAVPDLLTEVCHVSTELAAQIGQDILARAESYAMLDDILIAPFAEEIARYEPADSSLMLKGAVAVVVRSSLLEEAHAHGPVEADGIQGITTMAAAPLSHFLAGRRRNPVTVEHNLFGELADTWPRAWACLGAVAQAYGAGGGRWPYRFAAAPVPELPAAEVEAPATDTRDGAVILSGIDPRFDREAVQRMREAAEPGDAVWLTTSLSRISRHLGKLLQAVEYLLAHDVPILTANYLLRPREVWVRRDELATVDHEDPLAAWRSSRGLSGVHRAVAAQAVKQMEAKEKAAKGRTPHRPGDEKDLPKTRRNAGQGYEELGRSFSEVRFSSRFYAISPTRFPTLASLMVFVSVSHDPPRATAFQKVCTRPDHAKLRRG
jgi:Resolvase, N terminal domain